MMLRSLSYPLLRLVRRFLILVGRSAADSYNSKFLASEILMGDVESLEGRASHGCKFWQLENVWRDKIRVLDFGGGSGRCGHEELNGRVDKWAVVETSEMVQAATLLDLPNLKFFASLANASNWLGRIDVVHSSSSLQYTPNPASTLLSMVRLAAPYLIFEKTVVSERPHEVKITQLSFLRDNVHMSRRKSLPRFRVVSYPLNAMPANDLFQVLRDHEYEVTAQWVDSTQSHLPLGKGLRQIGFVARRKGRV